MRFLLFFMRFLGLRSGSLSNLIFLHIILTGLGSCHAILPLGLKIISIGLLDPIKIAILCHILAIFAPRTFPERFLGGFVLIFYRDFSTK